MYEAHNLAFERANVDSHFASYVAHIIAAGVTPAEGGDVDELEEVVSAAEAYHAAKALHAERTPLKLAAQLRERNLSETRDGLKAALDSYVARVVAEQLKKGEATGA